MLLQRTIITSKSYDEDSMTKYLPDPGHSKHQTLAVHWFNVGPPSATMA